MPAPFGHRWKRFNAFFPTVLDVRLVEEFLGFNEPFYSLLFAKR
jgi:hypothetical protein